MGCNGRKNTADPASLSKGEERVGDKVLVKYKMKYRTILHNITQHHTTAGAVLHNRNYTSVQQLLEN